MMQPKHQYKFLLAALFYSALFVNCSSGGSDDSPPPIQIETPSAASLDFPLENSECTEGFDLTSSQSTVNFNWSDAANASSYQLVLKNLETQGITNHNSAVSNLGIMINRATPYSWYVISKNSGTDTAQSTTWKFYNAGEAASSYAPFPAELVSPVMGIGLDAAITNTLLEWSGSDIENDIVDYEVFFGTDNPPTNSLGIITSTTMTATVSSANVYYWRVVTKDSQNNTSNSEIFQFKVY